MWAKRVSRQEFVEIFQREGRGAIAEAPQGDLLIGAQPQEVQLIWREDPKARPSLPVAVVVEPKERRDFLAWVASYLQSFRPFTAHCRVIDTPFAAKHLHQGREVSLGQLENVYLGLILGEAATELHGRGDFRNPSLSSCTGTFSYAMSRALAVSIAPSESALVSETWSTARRIARYIRAPLDVAALNDVWGVAVLLGAPEKLKDSTEMPSPPPSILQACRDVQQSGEIQPANWAALVGDVPELASLRQQMQGVREDRVVAFERAVSVLAHQGSIRPHEAFLCGYLASEIAPGSIDHLRLLSPFIQRFSTVFLWYGLCAGLRNGSSLRDYSSGLGRRILRDLLQYESLLERPTCDIALAELEVLSSGTNQLLDFRTRNQGQLEVELLPCLTVNLRWAPRREAVEDLAPPQIEKGEIRQLFEELDWTLHRADVIYEKLTRLLGISRSSGGPRRRGRR